MAEKPKFNKTSLKRQRDSLAKYQKFLPILLLKKMQLQLVIRQMEPIIEGKKREIAQTATAIRPWAALLATPNFSLDDYLQLQAVATTTDNIAGVEVPEFGSVTFRDIPYSFFATPVWLDAAMEALQTLIALREELKVLQRKETLLREELRTTTQRVNLFEKRLIPELKENIRRIKIFLGDEETAAVGRAKLAKGKIAQA